MVVLDFDQKDAFLNTAQTQNLGRLLASVCREAQDVIRDLATRSETTEGAVAASSLVENTTRQDLWERVRVLRELYLKCFVLVSLNGDLGNISDLIQIGASVWDVRETVRRRAQEFYEIQWPPMGSYPPPQAPWALDVAANVLVSKDPRTLPKLAQLAVEQTGSGSAAEAIKNIRLPLKARQQMGQRLTSIIRAEYALALSRTKDLRLNTLKFTKFWLEMGRVHLESPGEFHVTLFTNFRRYQFERYRVYIGGRNITAPDLEVMGSNTLQSACNVVVDTFETLKNRALYEVNSWKALINASKETRQKAKDLRMLARWLRATKAIDKELEITESADQLLHNDLFERVMSAGQVQDTKQIDTPESIHKDDDDELFEPANEPEEGPAGDSEPPKLQKCEDIDEFCRQLYEALWRLERNCLIRLTKEREAYRCIESNEFSLEFYRFVVLIAARIARYGALLMLRDQARNMTKCTAVPGGVIHVREYKIPPEFVKRLHSAEAESDTMEEQAGSSEGANKESTEGNASSWRQLFKKYFIPPPDSPPSLADEYPESVELVPFADLFPVAALPVHTDMIEIDFLPGLPLNILSEALGTKHSEKICRLSFGLSQSQAEFFVKLQPLHSVIETYLDLQDDRLVEDLAPDEIPMTSEQKEALVKVVTKLRQVSELRHFYSSDLREISSSSLIPGFAGEYSDLTAWIAHGYEVLSQLILLCISHEVECREHWQVLKLTDGIELKYRGARAVKIYVNLLTGYLDIYPIVNVLGSVSGSSRMSMIADNTDILVASLSEGDVKQFLAVLEHMEDSLLRQSAEITGGYRVCEEIVLDDDDSAAAGQPQTKRSKIV